VLTSHGILTLERKFKQNSVGESLLAKVDEVTAHLFRANSKEMTVNRMKDGTIVVLFDGLKVVPNWDIFHFHTF
jgi:hypothetical protein